MLTSLNNSVFSDNFDLPQRSEPPLFQKQRMQIAAAKVCSLRIAWCWSQPWIVKMTSLPTGKLRKWEAKPELVKHSGRIWGLRLEFPYRKYWGASVEHEYPIKPTIHTQEPWVLYWSKPIGIEIRKARRYISMLVILVTDIPPPLRQSTKDAQSSQNWKSLESVSLSSLFEWPRITFDPSRPTFLSHQFLL